MENGKELVSGFKHRELLYNHEVEGQCAQLYFDQLPQQLISKPVKQTSETAKKIKCLRWLLL